MRVPLPAHALRFLRLAGFPYEGWESSGPYLDCIQLYPRKGVKENGEIGFTDELVFRFWSRLPPFGKDPKPVQSAAEACERTKTLLGGPSGYRYSATFESTDSWMYKGSKDQWWVGKKYYVVAAKNPALGRTYAVMMWADSGVVFSLDLIPRPPRTIYNRGPVAPPGY